VGNVKTVNHNVGVRALQLLIAAGTGVLVGFVVFTIDHITGRNLYLILGAIAGVMAFFLQRKYWRTMRLSELTITVPQLSELKFVVNDDARLVAWQLYIETVTRVSTQPLSDDGGGFLREALTSLYGLFITTRDILKAGRPSVPVAGGQTVEYLAVTMLNRHLRPFLSKWHPRLREFETADPTSSEVAWPDNHACRSDLRQVQGNLVEFALGFAQLAGVRDAKEAIKALDQR
jgi:hypothetical protein